MDQILRKMIEEGKINDEESATPQSSATNNQIMNSPKGTIQRSLSFGSGSVDISDITFDSKQEDETSNWTRIQRKKIIEQTETLESAIGTRECCNRNCVSNFSLAVIRAKRYSFYHLNNENKRHQLNLCKMLSTDSNSYNFVIDGKVCCIEAVTRILGVSRQFLCYKPVQFSDKPLNTKGSKIIVWLLDVSNFSDQMPDTNEFHLPFMNKVNSYCF